LLEQLAAAGPPLPHVILTGGDPLKRNDLFELIASGHARGLEISVSPSATPLLTEEAVDRLRVAGVKAISLSIDGSTSERHDTLRGVPGCFARTVAAARRASEIGLAFQVNTLVSRETLGDLASIEALVRSLDADRWSLFFLVHVGRGSALEALTAAEAEKVLGWLAGRAREPGPVITTTEAPHFRRVVLEVRRSADADADASDAARRSSGADEAARRSSRADEAAPRHHGAGIRDGNGVMFIGHDGSVTPSGFLPLPVGNAKLENPLRLYRDSALFRSLRDADGFRGRCGRCDYRFVCGGSRARAYAASGDPLAEDPLCTYQPRGERQRAAQGGSGP
jgi:MoaA/NifB/PqqE/SkfB family radical SAM enzyme